MNTAATVPSANYYDFDVNVHICMCVRTYVLKYKCTYVRMYMIQLGSSRIVITYIIL